MFRFRFVFVVFLTVVISSGVCQAVEAEDEAQVHKFTVTIDTGRTAEPVSKYIYGQFIEHMGKCIYGGIWAEMLEDRKFLYPVASKQSPWKVIGAENAVRMTDENPYVGEHTPQIQLPGNGKPCGIFQDKLGLVKGKEYTGRLVIAGCPETAPIKVSLIWGESERDRQTVTVAEIKSDYTVVPFSFKANKSTDNGRLEIAGEGEGSFRIGTASLMPADNIKGMRADTLKLLKELNSPIYRWPGGNFVSGYNFRDGLGPCDKRPPRKNPAWNGIEHNDFGLDEFIIFCREIGTEPMIAVNTGFGDDHSAAQEVEYANGSADTPMGRWRAANGHPKPYKVKWWCVGNEMFGKWQLGYMDLNHYVRKHNLFAVAMRKVDPSIKLIAVGDAASKWSEGMLTNCAEYMDLISEHFYEKGDKSVIRHVRQMHDAVGGKISSHRDYRTRLDSLKGKDIRLAIDEWNYWSGEHVFGEYGTRYFLKDALGIAAGLHEMIRNTDLVFMANYAQTVNVLGAIKTTKTAAVLETTGLALKLYRNHFAALPVDVTSETDLPDVVAALTDDRKTLTVAIVNPAEYNCELMIDLKGAQLTDKGTLWLITHTDPMAYNEPGKEPNVVIDEKPLTGIADRLNLPPWSVSLYKLAIKK